MSRSALSSPVHDRSGLRFGSLLTTLPALIAPWYSSATVGIRSARPSDALKVQSSLDRVFAAQPLRTPDALERERVPASATQVGDTAGHRLRVIDRRHAGKQCRERGFTREHHRVLNKAPATSRKRNTRSPQAAFSGSAQRTGRVRFRKQSAARARAAPPRWHRRRALATTGARVAQQFRAAAQRPRRAPAARARQALPRP